MSDTIIPIFDKHGRILSQVYDLSYFSEDSEYYPLEEQILEDFPSNSTKTYLDAFIVNQDHAKESMIFALKNAFHKFQFSRAIETSGIHIPRQVVFCETYNNARESDLINLLSKAARFPLINIRLNQTYNSVYDILEDVKSQGLEQIEGEGEFAYKENLNHAIIHFQDLEDVLFITDKKNPGLKTSCDFQNMLVDFINSEKFFSNYVSTKFMTSIITCDTSNINTNEIGYSNKRDVESYKDKHDRLLRAGLNSNLLEKVTFFTYLTPPLKGDVLEQICLPKSYLSNRIGILKKMYGISISIPEKSLDILADKIIKSNNQRNIFEITDLLLKKYYLYPEEFVALGEKRIVLTPDVVRNTLKNY